MNMLTCVHSHVFCQYSLVCEIFITLVTFKGTITSMSTDVFLQITFLRERLVTLITFMWSKRGEKFVHTTVDFPHHR